MTTFKADSAARVADVVAWAAAERQPLEIVAGGTKRALGRPVRADHVIDVSGLRGIVDHDAAELVLTARPGTPMADIAASLDKHGQMLAWEPPDWRALVGATGEPTLGGVIACNLSGPRRVRAGAARDHLLGFAAVNGRGEPWKAGGKVVKNVTGYDMCKLQAGAFGTLSVLTELSVRVLPRPETEATVVLTRRTDADALSAMAAALNSPHEVSAAAHLPDGRTALRLEGPRPSVAFRADTLATELGATDRLDGPESARVWRDIGEVAPLLDRAGAAVWRVCPTPSAAASIVASVRAACPSARALIDWGGGLVWLAIDEHEPQEPAVRAAVRASGGHASLVRGTADARARATDDTAPALAALSRRIKDGFDPNRVLNPGRMREDI